MSETFDPAWLELREEADHRARATELTDVLSGWWRTRGAERVLDLGCGTGSNLAYLAGRLPTPQSWTLVDHDEALLARVRRPAGDVKVRTVHGDLAEVGLAEVGGADVVTASALLDLVSEPWLTRLAEACAAARVAALFALTYDGTVEWGPERDTGDALVLSAVNEHQRRDKSLGAALGPAAARVADALFRARGYRTRSVRSPWRLGRADAALALELVRGWANAAAEQRPGDAGAVRAWAERRTAAIERGDFSLVVGHVDLLALPADEAPEGW